MSDYLKEINKNEVLKYLGYKCGKVEPELLDDIEKCSDEVIRYSVPKVIYRVFDIDDKSFAFKGTNFIPYGKDIREILSQCQKAVAFAATIGTEIENIIRRYEVNNLYRALIIDSCASSAVENVCDNFQNELEEKINHMGLFITDRFSPGYGDMPFEQQKDMCSVLNTSKTIGVCLSRSGIMIPRKSVTAIIGISKEPHKKRGKGCEYCSMFENCEFRKDGITCGKI
ncbi:methionine synthase [Lachnospiraceae bacterium NSJ-143]|nr:methionine synthase [Lachnospiraceae bacterium NSJ-143]